VGGFVNSAFYHFGGVVKYAAHICCCCCTAEFSVLPRLMTEWDSVSTFMNMLEESPLKDNFETWWQEIWVPLQTKCRNIARHKYVLKSALNRYKQVEATTWGESFNPSHEEQQVRRLCQQVCLDEEEFLTMGFHHHRNACRKVFSLRVSQH
jgi:hypothetical protein